MPDKFVDSGLEPVEENPADDFCCPWCGEDLADESMSGDMASRRIMFDIDLGEHVWTCEPALAERADRIKELRFRDE